MRTCQHYPFEKQGGNALVGGGAKYDRPIMHKALTRKGSGGVMGEHWARGEVHVRNVAYL